MSDIYREHFWDALELFYFPSINRFMDLKGNVIYALDPYMSVRTIEAWKANENRPRSIIAKTGDILLLYYIDEDTEETLISHKDLHFVELF